MNDLIWLLISSFYVAAVLALASFMRKRGVEDLYVRKTVHMLVSLWILIMAWFIESPVARITGPAIFVLINLFFYLHFGNAGAGIVFYPLSLTVMIALMLCGVLSENAVVAGTLVMGLGDGAAAIAGTLLGRKRRSPEGSAVMFIVSFNVIMAAGGSIAQAVITAAAATAAERFTPSALDNVTVPLLTAGLMEVLCAL